MKTLTIIIVKIIIYILEAFNRGSSMPGVIAQKLDKNILKKFKLPETTIVVTGSSGKGSTSKMISNVYKKMGYTVTYNNKGSNQTSAIITTLIKDCNLKGEIKNDIVVMELDERYTKEVFKSCKVSHVIITNITRDQPPRQHHVDFIFETINEALNKDIHLILNADDPYLLKFNLNNEFKTTYYSLNKSQYSYTDNIFTSLNIYRCPKCLENLTYNYYHFEQLGDYTCLKCNFKKPKSKYSADFNYDDNTLIINKKYNIKIKNDILYNIYNTLAAFTALAINKLDVKQICKYIEEDTKPFIDIYNLDDKKLYILNNKNENSTTFNQSILYAKKDSSLKTIIVGWKEISRRYEWDDLSWLYDVEFDLFEDEEIDKVICVGPQKYDIALRFKYSNISDEKIIVFDNLDLAKDEILNSKNNIYAIVNFDYVEPLKRIMEESLWK